MTHKPGFIYMQSASLRQMIAYGKKSGMVFCEDKTVYTQNEINLFVEAGETLDLATHWVKKIFGGEVVQIERYKSGSAENERIEGRGAGSTNSGTHPGENLPPPLSEGAGRGSGDLDLY